MANKKMFFVQVFEIDRKNKLIGGRSYECDNAEHAERRARLLSEKVPGVVAFEQVFDNETGDAEEPRLICSFGRVPTEVRDVRAV